jgi:hypothetical protein
VGTKVSGNTTSPAPAAPASSISRQALSTVASRSRNTGVACTAAAVTFSIAPTSLANPTCTSLQPACSYSYRSAATGCMRAALRAG